MRVIQEDTVRQMFLKQGITEIHVDKNTIVTQQAKDYIRDKRLKLVEDDGTQTCPRENKDIHPPRRSGGPKYVTEEGKVLQEKPEYMTHIHGNTLVMKNHPVIAFRGQLDSLEAQIIQVQYQASLEGQDQIVSELDEILSYCRSMLACEVTGKPLPGTTLLGLDEEQQRDVSHYPQKYFGIGHLLPGYQMDKWAIQFNLLRTRSREVELSAIAAFVSADGNVERTDILQGMNRLSSVFYIMMCRSAAGIYSKTEG